jgi:hypothetical protein
MTPRANIIWWVLLFVLGALLALVVRAQPLRLSWNTVPTADHYHVYAGTNTGEWFTNWTTPSNSTTFQLTEPGRYYFAVAAGREESNYFAQCALSETVCFELLSPPPIDGEMSVRLTTVLETSEDLRNWRGMTSAPTWLIATGMAGFFRNPKLQIEKQKTVTP